MGTLKRFVRLAKTIKAPLYLGVDSGSTGALGFVCGDLHTVVDIPTIKVKRGKGKNQTLIDCSAVLGIFRLLRPLKDKVKFAALEIAIVGIPGKGNSAYNGFAVGRNYGAWSLFLMSKGFSLEEFHPTVWKKKMKLHGKGKEDSRFLAQKMFPKADLQFKKHHDRAEALLLAEFLRRLRKGKI